MRTTFRKGFTRDLKKIKDQQMLQRVKKKVEEIEEADLLEEVSDVTKISGASGFFRVRIGTYRLGIAVEGDTVEFVRCLHRRDIYRYFP